MNTKDEALRLALEALEYIRNCETDVSSQTKYGQAEEVIKQALEQPEPEPVAWIDHRIHGFPDCFVMQPEPPHTSPVYTSPPKREPLTNGEIYTAYITATNQTLRAQDERLAFAFARAIEAAHGIFANAQNKGEA